MASYMIVAIDFNGTKYATTPAYVSYDKACKAQEMLEETCSDFAFLLYTMDEWLHECEML